ncbi:MAG TPA: NAD/NADP octopine/nopaline dehydrogenase family protein [Stellaceae bacterium]|nr:NAD/NADP octopine/nopaline dehydrogenase family protein [Stellaceae bacterium]
MTDARTIAIIGAGNGGFNLAAHLGAAGHTIRLHDIDASRLAEFVARGGIETGPMGSGFAPLALATTDLAAAVRGADVIVIATGGHRQASAATALAPVLADGQTILLVQGNTGGSLAFRRVLDEARCRAAIDLAEMDNFPYSARKLGPAKMTPIVTKRWLQIAAFPGNRIDAAFAVLGPLFPTAVPVANVLHTGFTNANAMLHVAICVANAARIERGEAFKFYAEGVTNGVARVLEAISDERVKAAAAFGASVPTLVDWFDRVYKVREATLVEAFQKLTYTADGPYGGTPTPKSFDNNYVAEDVPVGLMPIVALGRAAGVAMPATQALIDMACILTGTNYANSARTLERMGLAGKNAVAIRKVVATGFG